MSTELFIADYAPPAATFTRIAVAAGPRMVCDAFAARLVAEEGLHAISAPGHVYQAVQTARTFSPDVVVVDITMFKESEDVVVRELSLLPTAPAIVGFVGKGDVTRAVRILEAGAIAAVQKDAPSSEMILAVKWSAQGAGWISPPLLRGVISSFQSESSGPTGEKLRNLTNRELEILQLVVDGYSRREIANKLYLSIETVRTHMCTIMNKFDVHSAIAAAAVGRASGMQPARRTKEQRVC